MKADSIADQTGPGWNDTPVAGNPRPKGSTSIFDQVPQCELSLGNQCDSYFVLVRGSSIRNADHIVQLPAGHKFVKDHGGRLDKHGRIIWRCIHSHDGCKCRIDTPPNYDNPNEPDQRKVDLKVQIRKRHFPYLYS